MDARAPIAVLWAMRAVVLTVGEEDPNVIAGVRALGADTVVTTARPSLAAAHLAEAAGLRYIPFLSTADVDRLLTDSGYRAAVSAIPGIAGFHYMNDQIIEGYTSAVEQERAYTILKSLFPAAIVIHPTRLDLLATDPTFADSCVRPEFTDYVAPYFYPVASTVLGPQQEDDPWEERLARVRNTRGWDENDLRRRENLQHPLDNKREMSNYIVQNTADVGFARRQVREVLSRILANSAMGA